MSWFRGDFGYRKRSIKHLSKFQIIPSNVKPDLSYKDYDWTIDLDNFFIETAVINTSKQQY
jgi:hypothetical protein